MTQNRPTAQKITIGVDHGNKEIKTVSCEFVTGLISSSVAPPGLKEYIKLGDNFYTLSFNRLPYQRDKTTSENFWVLTLFAIVKELEVRRLPGTMFDVSLGVGLPPQHFSALKKKFQDYFANRGRTYFTYKGREYGIYVEYVNVFPQAYASIMPDFGEISKNPKLFIVDIGGYTTDILLLRKGQPDMAVCYSLECGVIKLYNNIINRINARYELILSEEHIDSVLLTKDSDLPEEIQNDIRIQAKEYAENIVSQLRERECDLRLESSLFIGGGAVLLKEQLEATGKLTKAKFVDDIHANAKGYEWAANAAAERRR